MSISVNNSLNLFLITHACGKVARENESGPGTPKTKKQPCPQKMQSIHRLLTVSALTLALMLAFAAGVTLFDGLQVVGAMGLRAQGVVWLPTIIHVGSYVGIMLPLCVWLAFTPETAPPANNLLGAVMFWPAHWPGAQGLGVWGVFIGISVASVAAGTAQVLSLEWKSRTAGERADKEGAAAPVVVH